MREARMSAYLLSPPLALLLSFPEFLLYFSDQRSLFLDSEHCSRIFFLFFFFALLSSALVTHSNEYSLFKQPMPLKSYLSNIFPQHMSKFAVSAFIP